MKFLFFICILIGSCNLSFGQPFPQTTISNGLITATLYLPDSSSGYNRATRFDRSGVVKDLAYKGHSYFGVWNKKYDPKLHDAITGPVEEFQPLEYEQAKAGEPFLKIGVGMLQRTSEKPYSFSTLYPVVRPGEWKIKTDKDRTIFTHVLQDAQGWAYEYTKTVRLVKGKPELVLEHSLRNTGTRSLETNVYNHNFFVIDSQRTGPAIRTSFPFELNDNGTGHGLDTIGKISNNQISYLRNLQDNENMYIGSLTGFQNDAKDYAISIENLHTGAGVHITCDKPLARLVFWSCSTTSCPEPYIHIKADPGQTFKWTITYRFYEMPVSEP